MAIEITVRTRITGKRKMKFERLQAEKEKSTSDLLRDAIDLLIEREELKRKL